MAGRIEMSFMIALVHLEGDWQVNRKGLSGHPREEVMILLMFKKQMIKSELKRL